MTNTPPQSTSGSCSGSAETDRELLELAAQAAGIEIEGVVEEGADAGRCVRKNGTWWSPLHDDGDALRLAVKLEIELHIYEGHEVDAMFDGRRQTCSEPWGVDGLAAARRAIVRAAAALAASKGA